MNASGGSVSVLDVDHIQANLALSSDLTLDKTTWAKVFFSMLGGSVNSVANDQNIKISCTLLDANTVTLHNESNGSVCKVGIKALRVS